LEEEQQLANNKLESLQQMVAKLKASALDLSGQGSKEESKESYKDSSANANATTDIIRDLKAKVATGIIYNYSTCMIYKS